MAGEAVERPGDESGRDSKGRHPALRDDDVERALDAMIVEGRPRLHRTVAELLASGVIAGVEITLGILAFLAVDQATGSQLLAGVAFSIGFVALLLGHSELFTEGFLVPVAVIAAKEASWWHLLRFWGFTLLGNLAGGWLMTWMIMTALPDLRATAVRVGTEYATEHLSGQTFVLALLAGSVITMLTRMRIGTTNDVARIVACVAVAFLLAGLGMLHSILDSFFMFAGIHAGATYGYADWVVFFGWTLLANVIGGLGLTTFIRLVRSHERLYEWRRSPRHTPHQGDDDPDR